VEEGINCLETLSEWPVLTIDYNAIQDAAGLTRDAVLSFWDALIIVAAARSGAVTLYTEDLNHGQEILGVRITNPFL
jgi:predicted nucleic acid-binding protein